MNPLALGAGFILVCLALCGHRWLLLALGFAVVVIFPVFNPTAGMRSAVYAQEAVLAAGFLPWLIRDLGQPKLGVLPSMRGHWIVLVIYVFFCTAIGYLLLGQFTEIPIRSTLAAIRFSGIALVFIMASSVPLSEEAFRWSMRWFYYAMLAFLALGLMEQVGITHFGVYKFEKLEVSGVSGGLGMFVRASLGTMTQIGFFLAILLLTIKEVNPIVGVGGLLGFLGLMLASLSRTNIMATGVFVLLYILFQKGTRARNLMSAGIGLIAAIAIVMSSPTISARLGTVGSTEETTRALSMGGRTQGWLSAIEYIVTNPMVFVFGSGFDCWQFRLQYFSGLYIGHNAFLSAWGELGVLGTILYYGIIYRFGKWVLRARKIEGSTGKICTLTLCFLVSLCVGSMSADVMYPAVLMIPVVYTIMFLLGLIYGRLQDPYAWTSEALYDANYSEYYPTTNEYVLTEPPQNVQSS